MSCAALCRAVHACRTLEQARKLDKMLSAKGTQIDAVLDFDVPDSLLVSSRGFFGFRVQSFLGFRV